jgi:heme oxygenase
MTARTLQHLCSTVRQLAKMLTKLNLETREFHGRADYPWLPLLDETKAIGHSDYAKYLIERYGFEAPLEAALAYTPHLGDVIDVHPRFRAGLIAKDLIELGLSASAVASIQQCMIEPFASPEEAFGWLYVHERCTLMFEHVSSELCRRIPDLCDAMSYLHANAGHIGAAWESFTQALDRVSATPEAQQQVVEAAREAFLVARRWQLHSIDEHN